MTAWTKEDDAKLIELRPDYTNLQIAALMGRSAKAISSRGYKLEIAYVGAPAAMTDAAFHELWQGVSLAMRANPAQNLSWGIA